MFGSIALLKKPRGISSFAALFPLKRSLKTKKLGHTGTLDPFADGLLVALCGYATRLAPFFDGLDKRYEAEFRFGVTTDTLDPEGVTIQTGEIPTAEVLHRVLPKYVGITDQVPPMFSAVKVGGRRAYQEARKGKPVELKPRSIEVFSLELREYTPPVARISVHSSKGTYIRSLARDIGVDCGSAAYVTRLKRTDVGPFRLDEIPENELWRLIRPVDALRRVGATIVITDATGARRLRQGKPINLAIFEPTPHKNGKYAVASHNGDLVAVIEVSDNGSRSIMVVPEAATTSERTQDLPL